jgi:hypothetical protein
MELPMWEKLVTYIKTNTGQIVIRMFAAVVALFLFWIHPVLLFPVGLFVKKLELEHWHLFAMNWQTWKECLIPIAVYVPAHLLIFG